MAGGLQVAAGFGFRGFKRGRPALVNCRAGFDGRGPTLTKIGFLFLHSYTDVGPIGRRSGSVRAGHWVASNAQ